MADDKEEKPTMASKAGPPTEKNKNKPPVLATPTVPKNDLPLQEEDQPNEEEDDDPLANLPKITEPVANKDEYQRRKQGAKVYDAQGKPERRRRIMNSLGLSDLVMPPLMRKSTAMYRIIDRMRIDPATKLPPDPTDAMYPGTYMFYDIGETDLAARGKMMKNITGRHDIRMNPMTRRQEIIDDDVDQILFTRGVITVAIERDFIKYVFLELHPLNGSNKFRDKTVPAQFERIDLKSDHSKAYNAAEMDLAFEAEQSVMQMDRNRLIATATSAGIPTMEYEKLRGPSDIAYDLRHYARTRPKEFFNLTANTKAAIKLNVVDAISWGLLDYVESNKAWVDVNSEQRIHVVPVGEDPTDSLVTFFAESDNRYYDNVMKMMNYWDFVGIAS